MTIWIALWLVLSAVLIYFLLWTFFILYKQKTAWKAYGKRKELRYSSASMLSPPALDGPYEEYTVNLFTGEHMASDMRGSRKLTAIELHLSGNMPVMGGVASGGMVEVLRALTIKDEVKPKHEDWSEDYVAVSESRNVLEAYLTSARIEALTKLMKIKNAWIILIFKGDTSLLRLDTPEPIASEKKLDVLVQRMIKTARVLEFESGEEARLKAEEAKKPRKQAEIKVADGDIDIGGIQLEDDEPDPVPEPDEKLEEPEKIDEKPDSDDGADKA